MNHNRIRDLFLYFSFTHIDKLKYFFWTLWASNWPRKIWNKFNIHDPWAAWWYWELLWLYFNIIVTCEINSNRINCCLAIANPNLPYIQGSYFLEELFGCLKIFDGEMMFWAEYHEVFDKWVIVESEIRICFIANLLLRNKIWL